MEQSLVIIKPDGVVRRRVGALVIDALLKRGYSVKAFKEMVVSDALAKMHYAVHKDKPFFPWLVEFITSAPVVAIILEGEGVIEGVREALGATFVQKAAPESLRGRYGIWAGVNIAHASDGPDTAAEEIALWKREAGLEEEAGAEEKAREYIGRYIHGETDYTGEIRAIVRDAIAKKDTSEGVLKKLEELLSKDADDIPQDSVRRLARVIFDFIHEEVEKA